MKTLLTTLALLSVFGIVYAKQVSVEVLSPTSKNIKAEVTNILPNTQIDITETFTADDKIKVKQGLNLDSKEDKEIDALLAGDLQTDPQAFIAMMNKLLKEKPLSSDEVKEYIRTGNLDFGKYLGRLKVEDTL